MVFIFPTFLELWRDLVIKVLHYALSSRIQYLKILVQLLSFPPLHCPELDLACLCTCSCPTLPCCHPSVRVLPKGISSDSYSWWVPALLSLIFPNSKFHRDFFICSGYNYSCQDLHPQPHLGEVVAVVCGKEHCLPLEMLWREPFLYIINGCFLFLLLFCQVLPSWIL